MNWHLSPPAEQDKLIIRQCIPMEVVHRFTPVVLPSFVVEIACDKDSFIRKY